MAKQGTLDGKLWIQNNFNAGLPIADHWYLGSKFPFRWAVATPSFLRRKALTNTACSSNLIDQ
jgi:hypothetical protein